MRTCGDLDRADIGVECRMQGGHAGPHLGFAHAGPGSYESGALWLAWDDTGRTLARRGDCGAEEPVPGQRLPLECVLVEGHPGVHSYQLADFIAERRRQRAYNLDVITEPLRMSLENHALRGLYEHLIAAADTLVVEQQRILAKRTTSLTAQQVADLRGHLDRFAAELAQAHHASRP